MGCRRKYIIWFSNELTSFRWPEFDSIVSLFNLDIDVCGEKSITDPFIPVTSSSLQDIKKLSLRSTLIRKSFLLLGHGSTRDSLWQEVRSNSVFQNEFNLKSQSFKLDIESYNKKMTASNKMDIIEDATDHIPINGSINLDNPDVTFSFVETYGTDTCKPSPHVVDIYFGVHVSYSGRFNVHKINLKERKFISNTTMDPHLSLLMSNMARVTHGDLVYDPFVGSGSLLVAAAVHGGLVMGGDIDYKLLHGMSRPTRYGVKERQSDESLYETMKVYGLQDHYLDIMIMDASIPMFKNDLKFDAIICDPPYGIRESSARVGTKKVDTTIPSDLVNGHFPSKVHYGLDTCILNLIQFAGETLNAGGRLLFWVPVMKHQVDHVHPHHPLFKLVSSSVQDLQGNTARILFCMERLAEGDGDDVHCDVTQVRESLKGILRFKDEFYSHVHHQIEKKRNKKLTK